jgi:hypothetical protein
MSKDADDFDQFLKKRQEAAQAYVEGDAKPLESIVTRVSPASFFGPKGGIRVGAGHVSSAYTRDAAAFEPGGETHLEILHQGAGDGTAYWVGFQHAKVRMRGHADPVAMKLRVTEVFRRDGTDWKLVHRHADALSESQSE